MKKRYLQHVMFAITMALCITTTTSAFASNGNSIKTAFAADASESVTSEDPYYVDLYDCNNDGTVSIADPITLAKAMAGRNDTGSFRRIDPNADGIVDSIDLRLLLRYLCDVEQEQQNVTTTETTTTTTTTETTTTTTTAETTTTTTTAETTATTTTAETTTTTTTTETTTTTTTTETTATTSTTSPKGSLVNEIARKISVTDTTIPAYCEDLYEVTDNVFLFKVGNVTYAYTILAENEEKAQNINLLYTIRIVGLHIWEYEGDETPVSISDSLPNTDGLTFYCEDPSIPNKTEFTYSLKPYNKLNDSVVSWLAASIAENRTQGASDISGYDYNLNGVLDEGDLEIAIRYYSSNPYNYFSHLNEEAFQRYIDFMPELGHTNVVLHSTSTATPQEYAFNIPTKDLEYSDNSAVVVPVQILPIEDADLLSDYEEETLDEDADEYSWIAWIPTMELWCKIPESSDYWSFRAGYYVYCLDSNGNYINALID